MTTTERLAALDAEAGTLLDELAAALKDGDATAIEIAAGAARANDRERIPMHQEKGLRFRLSGR